MSEQFFLSLQQDIKLAVLSPILCAIFRAIFIGVYNPYPSLAGKGKTIWHCFRYGFWWGMDFNAYGFLLPFVLVTLPGLVMPAWAGWGDSIRVGMLTAYWLVLYAAFMGKLIFYKHFHDTYNYMVHYGKHAEKHNLWDIFIHQDHGTWVLLGFMLMAGIGWFCGHAVLQLPSVPFPGQDWGTVGLVCWNTALVILSVAGFYWFRYGGTFMHDDKPEWDTIPSIVKEDVFFARACVDDLVALENAIRRPLRDEYMHSDEDLAEAITNRVPVAYKDRWQDLPNPLYAFKRTAKGARISKPKHIFLIVGESIPQWSLDSLYKDLNIAPGLWRFKDDPHTAVVPHFLPAGNVSRPSIVSLLTGVYDAGMELNEQEQFWLHPFPTSLAAQMKALGYQTIYWYGGNASYGNFNHFGRAQGFDRVESATTFCGSNAPKTWVGVYDHVFLEGVSRLLEDIDEPTFHFVYTTSNHGPYKMEDSLLDYNPEQVMPTMAADIKSSRSRNKALATYRYADKAIFDFIDRVRTWEPDSLIIVTGDHSNLFGDFANTSLVHRDYTLRERYNTVNLWNHPELNGESFASTIGTHMSIMPTIMEAVAPAGFTYYSVAPSLFDEEPPYVVTPYQWISPYVIGDFVQGCEQENHVSADEVPITSREVDHHREAEEWRLLTAWIMKHGDAMQR